MPRFGTKSLLAAIAVLALWLSTLTGYEAGADVRAAILFVGIFAAAFAQSITVEVARRFESASLVPSYLWQSSQTGDPYRPGESWHGRFAARGGVRFAGADQADCERQRAGAAANRDPAVRPRYHQGHRKRDHRQRLGAGEETKVAIRNIRRDANKQAEQEKKDKQLTEDESEQAQEEVQKLTKKFEDRSNDLAKTKEAEVMDE